MSKYKAVYLDHAATTPLDKDVLAAMKPYFAEDFGNASSIHHAGLRARKAVKSAREQVAGILGCASSEIIFTSGATESNNLALRGAMEAYCDLQSGTKGRAITGKHRGHIIISQIEHDSILKTARYLEKKGIDITCVGVDKYGLVDPKNVLDAIREDTFLVSIMYANNEIGAIQPIAAIGKQVQKRNILMHTDAAQAAGALSLDVKKLHTDMLSLSGHKFYGPKGSGVLYVRRGVQIAPQITGGGQEYKRRAGTENVPLIIGFSRALCLADKKQEQESKRLSLLRDWLIVEIERKIKGAHLTGDREKRLPNSASFCFPGIEGESLVMRLSERGFEASSGSACSSGNLEASHVLLALGLNKFLAMGSLRVAMGRSTAKKDLRLFVEALKEEVEKLS